MPPVRSTLAIAALLLLTACGTANQAARPLDMRSARAATAPEIRLAATSQALIDTPILEDRSASPTTTASPSTPSAATPLAIPKGATAPAPQPTVPSKPVRIVIPDIDMDRPLLQVGIDAETVPIVPKHDAGWYEGSAR